MGRSIPRDLDRCRPPGHGPPEWVGSFPGDETSRMSSVWSWTPSTGHHQRNGVRSSPPEGTQDQRGAILGVGLTSSRSFSSALKRIGAQGALEARDRDRRDLGGSWWQFLLSGASSIGPIFERVSWVIASPDQGLFASELVAGRIDGSARGVPSSGEDRRGVVVQPERRSDRGVD